MILHDYAYPFSPNRTFTNPWTSPDVYCVRVGRSWDGEQEGFSFWKFDGHQVHYVKVGDDSKPPIVLIHGFGASVFHWRYNIPELSKHFRVYAIDLLGFGLSDKPIIDYSAELWRDQVAGFLREVVGVDPKDEKSRAVVVGNSLGGYTALSAAAYHPDLVRGCAVLNGAGTFDENVPKPEPTVSEDDVVEQIKRNLQSALRKALLYGAFYLTKRPSRIKQVLQQVYMDPQNVDEELVESIRYPSLHPNAPEVFCRVVSRTSTARQLTTINSLLGILSVPLLLLWGQYTTPIILHDSHHGALRLLSYYTGDRDPWIGPNTARKMLDLYPSATKVSLDAGHW